MVSATSSPTSDYWALRFLGREFRFGNLNAICMKGPVPYALGLTELDLRCVPRTRFICSFDFKRALANFRFISIFSKNILHKPSDVPCHSKPPNYIFGTTYDAKLSRIHVPQPLAIAKDDLTGAGKSQHTLAMELRKRP